MNFCVSGHVGDILVTFFKIDIFGIQVYINRFYIKNECILCKKLIPGQIRSKVIDKVILVINNTDINPGRKLIYK